MCLFVQVQDNSTVILKSGGKMNFGFIRLASASLKLKVANPSYNKKEIIKAAKQAALNGAKLLVTPELSVTGYTCADLFFSSALLDSAQNALVDIARSTAKLDMVLLVGAPIRYANSIYNCCAVISGGSIVKLIPKTYIANYTEFYEKRWFASGADCCGTVMINGEEVEIGQGTIPLAEGAVLGVEICEDLWVAVPPSSTLALSGANIICNLSASDEAVSKESYRRSLVKNQSARCICAYVYAGASVFESTTDLVFSGATMICENGSVVAEGERFMRENVITYADVDVEKLNFERRKNMSFADNAQVFGEEASDDFEFLLENAFENDLSYRFVDAYPFVPGDESKRIERCREIFNIQASALAKRIEHVNSKGCVIGISGGLDSTLALLVAQKAMKLVGKSSENILGVTMPGFGTTDRTYTNALKLIESIGATPMEIDIKNACIGHMNDIGHNPDIKDITYENTQARERTQILFDLANKHGCLLVGTGDLSELAMGWCTYNGDHMSMYGVNASVPKTLVRYLVAYVATVSDEKTREVLIDVLDTPVSPELLPPDENGEIAQKTEENIGPYELHDFFLHCFVRYGFSKDKTAFLAEKAFEGKYSDEVIKKWLEVFIKRFFISQFKRSCVPDSPKVGSVSLSPRGDWRMPSDAVFDDFI